jgi:hypothetical protein
LPKNSLGLYRGSNIENQEVLRYLSCRKNALDNQNKLRYNQKAVYSLFSMKCKLIAFVSIAFLSVILTFIAGNVNPIIKFIEYNWVTVIAFMTVSFISVLLFIIVDLKSKNAKLKLKNNELQKKVESQGVGLLAMKKSMEESGVLNSGFFSDDPSVLSKSGFALDHYLPGNFTQNF